MALVNLDNKKQVVILLVAIGIGIVASVLVGNIYTEKVNEETTKLAIQYEKAQKQKEQQYNDQLAALNQKVDQAKAEAVKAAQEAAKAAAAAQKPAAVVVDDKGRKRYASLALKTPSGKRAVTVKIASLGAVGGLINPGDFVDVIAHLDVPSATRKRSQDKETTKESVTVMIFQSIQVLAINTNMDDPGAYDDQQKQADLKVTFAVNAEEASLLAFADKNGTLELALRSPNEKGRQMLPTATWNSLSEYVLENNGSEIDVPNQKPAEVKLEEPKNARPNIQIYRGGKEL